MSHWFFLSYARYAHGNRDRYLQKFYQDLNKTIRSLTIPGEGEDGFLDTRDIEVGSHWRDELIAGLQNCRTFISLYTPAYFTSEECGKEWQVFSSRQAAYSADLPSHAGRPSLMLPILWVPEDALKGSIPDTVSALQYNHSDFGDVYLKQGLKHMMELTSRYREAYREFLLNFAKKLLDSARAHNLPPHPQLPPINEIESAFRRREADVVMYSEEPVNAGPRYVQFVFVAGRRDELRAVREKIDSYGEEGGCDWHPYLPEVPSEVGIIAQNTAAKQNLHYGFLRPDDNIINQIEEAARQNRIIAIVVDTWTLLLQQYYTSMRKYDDRSFLNCVVLVAWNNRDDELTDSTRSILFNRMRVTFLHHSTIGNPDCFLEIGSHDELMKELPAVLNKARARIVEKTKVVKKAESGRTISKPRISGVRGASA